MKKQKRFQTKRGRIYSYGIIILLMITAGCDNVTSPEGSISDQQSAIHSTGQSSNMGLMGPTFSDPGNRPDIIEGHYIIVLSDVPGRENPRAAAALDALSKEVGNMQGARVKHTYKHALTGFSAELTDEQAENLRKDSRVQSLEQDRYVYPQSDFTVQEYPTWGLDRIDQREPLLDRAYAYTATGKGVTAYIIDSGIRFSHEEFGGRASLGYDFVIEEDPDNTDPNQGPGDDCMGHGTHVAGTVGGITYGVAKDVNLVSVRVFGCISAGTPQSRLVAAIDWITENAIHPAVVNMSLGYRYDSDSETSDAVEIAIHNSTEANIHYVAAGGNSKEDACLFSPAKISKVLTAGASQINDYRAWFSNYGECVDLYAPGVSIISAALTDDESGDGSYTRSASGTSMASPHVAGVVALYLESNPDSSPAEVHAAIVANTTQDVVSDVPFGTNNLVYSLWSSIEFTPPVSDMNLEAVGLKVRGNHVIDLSWSYTAGAQPMIYRNGSLIGYGYVDYGHYRDNTGISGNHATYVHQVCESEPFYINSCSEEVITIFGNGGGDGGEEPNSPPKADFTYQVDALTVQFTDASTDSDGAITSWSWSFGDEATSTEQHPAHTYAADGTYTVSLTVTDNDGGTGTASKNITVGSDDAPPQGGIILSANGYKERGRIIIDLNWSGTESGSVDIYRNNSVIASGITDSGSFTDHTGQNGGGTFTHKVCEAGTDACSNVTTTSF